LIDLSLNSEIIDGWFDIRRILPSRIGLHFVGDFGVLFQHQRCSVVERTIKTTAGELRNQLVFSRLR
jgi:hypothetical protein